MIISSNWGGGGPGGVVKDLYSCLKKNGHQCCFAYSRGKVPKEINSIRIGSMVDVFTHVLIGRIFDNVGFSSKNATRVFIKKVKVFNPDIINIHNLVGYNINVNLLFKFLKESNIKVVWTLHDCWAFTGHCINFDRIQCKKWIHGCHHCELKMDFPASYIFDNSKNNYKKKKQLFTGVKNMQLIVPSRWLGNLVAQSFLKKYPLHIIPNGIDLSIFRPTESNLRARYSLGQKTIVLAVASTWTEMKGKKYVFQVAERLDDSFQVVMIGIRNGDIIPKNVLGICRTKNQTELAQWYTAADIFINPTLGDNFPTVNLEALACGTPIVTFDTGGSPEAAGNEFGIVVEAGEIDRLITAIHQCRNQNICETQCVLRASVFDKELRFSEYINLFSYLDKTFV